MPAMFDPRQCKYKMPFGAVPCCSHVVFSLYPDRSDITGCTLLVYHEFADRWEELPLHAVQEGEMQKFSAVFQAPETAELIWYHFRFTWADGGTSCYGKQGHQPWNRVTPWQLTVYEENHTPSWFGRGVTYQIFPDRFFRSEQRPTDGLIGNRRLHAHWNEPVEYGPNEFGDYLSLIHI